MLDLKTESIVGQQVRRLRKQRGLSLRALAELCGISANAISLIERNEKVRGWDREGKYTSRKKDDDQTLINPKPKLIEIFY